MYEAEENTAHWDQFWQQGEAACCDDRGSPVHAQAVERVWTSLFESAAAGSSVLDMCTGNGGVLAIASGIGNIAGGLGVDFARTNPSLAPGFEFLRASVTALPLEDKSFDIVTSQFGIEYTPIEASMAEVARVLKPSGQSVFLIHATDGATATGARGQLDDLDELLDERQPFPAAREALDKVVTLERAGASPAAAARADAEAAYGRFYALLEWLGQQWQGRSAGDVFRNTGELLQHTFQHRQAFPLATLLGKVDETESSVSFHRARLQALVDAARDEAGMAELVELATGLGLVEADFEAIEVGGQTVAWRFTARRPGEDA
jgi:SAM-dependent methyltransferase